MKIVQILMNRITRNICRRNNLVTENICVTLTQMSLMNSTKNTNSKLQLQPKYEEIKTISSSFIGVISENICATSVLN